MNKIWLYKSPIFWTNSSEDKPTDKYIVALAFEEGDKETFTPNNDTYDQATLTSGASNITYVKWNNIYYLVASKIVMNNNNYRYILEKDVWANLALPFFKKQRNVALLRTSDSNEKDSALLEDSRINEIPLIYDEWEWKKIDYTQITRGLKHLRVRSNETAYVEYTSVSSIVINNSVSTNIYYVFDNTFAKLNEGKDGKTGFKINDQPYVFVPVIGDATITYTAGVSAKLNNTVSFLDVLALKKNFIGIFKGPDFLLKNMNRNSNNPNYSPIQYFVGAESFSTALPILYMNGGDNIFAQIEVPVVSKYQKLIYENSLILQNNYNINAKSKKYEVIFNGAGFIAYKDSLDKNTDIFNNNLIDTTIDYGSYLPSLQNSYQSYLLANKSQINAGIAKTNESLGLGVIGSLIAGLGAALAIPSGGSSLALATIGLGVAGSITGNFASKRQINARISDLKKNDSNINQSTDIIDNIMVRLMNKSYNGNTPKIITSSYFVQSLSLNSQVLINDIYDKYGFPSIKISSYSDLVTYSQNNKWCYFEVNLAQFEFYIQGSKDFNQLEKTLITLVFRYGIRLINE